MHPARLIPLALIPVLLGGCKVTSGGIQLGQGSGGPGQPRSLPDPVVTTTLSVSAVHLSGTLGTRSGADPVVFVAGQPAVITGDVWTATVAMDAAERTVALEMRIGGATGTIVHQAEVIIRRP